MTIFITAIAFFLLVTGLILIHEAGHFFAARRAKVEVEEFGFGLPPRAWKLCKWRGTDFTLNWIPFGGFVRLKGENATDHSERMAKGSFSRASIPARCAVLVAGVAMNFLLALCIFLYGFSAGQWIPTYLSLEDMQKAASTGEIDLHLAVVIDEVLPSGTAHDAGVASGSVLLSVDGNAVKEPGDVVNLQKGKRKVRYELQSLQEGAETIVKDVTVQDGKTGVYLRQVPIDVTAPRRNVVAALGLAMRETGVVTSQTVLGIGQLFSSLAQRGTVPEGVTGIVGIAQLTYTSVQQGFAVYLRLVALLSLSLAILNILPFPALDGGRLVFVLSELFVKPGNRRVELVTNTLGFAVLLFVIVLVTFYDIFRLFR